MLLTGTAYFSPQSTYRYVLTRTWGGLAPKRVCWIMLNPSTADASTDDPTIRRCSNFTRRWGYDGMVVVNLFALRATSPKTLFAHLAPVGGGNDEIIRRYLTAPTTALVVAVWGVHGRFRCRDVDVLDIATSVRRPVHVLGLTKDGHPRHPLYMRRDSTPQEWVS